MLSVMLKACKQLKCNQQYHKPIKMKAVMLSGGVSSLNIKLFFWYLDIDQEVLMQKSLKEVVLSYNNRLAFCTFVLN